MSTDTLFTLDQMVRLLESDDAELPDHVACSTDTFAELRRRLRAAKWTEEVTSRVKIERIGLPIIKADLPYGSLRLTWESAP